MPWDISQHLAFLKRPCRSSHKLSSPRALLLQYAHVYKSYQWLPLKRKQRRKSCRRLHQAGVKVQECLQRNGILAHDWPLLAQLDAPSPPS